MGCIWSTIIFLPTVGGEYQSIRLIEVLCKVISIIVDCCLEGVIELHDILHRFRSKRNMGTTTLNEKILQKIAGPHQEVFYEIFIDIHKSYYSIDRDITLSIMERYGVDPHVL